MKGGRTWLWILRNSTKKFTVTATTDSTTGNRQRILHKKLSCAGSPVTPILLGTGLRISEFCGLTTNLDFRNRLIRVDHQLLRDSENGYYIETPKTKSGYREIPMSEPV